ncbi:MAG TPA: hypothetical protein VMZ51_02510 [Acidimicrobiales bacterium]|nr:hypothetical protein [Acidimicrobiales bacterium]
MTHAKRRTPATPIVAALVGAAVMAGGFSPASANHRTVGAVRGSAFGYWSDDISIFGGVQVDTGPTPSVSLATNASNSPQSGQATTGLVSYPPATLFTSDGISLTTTGSTGTTGTVTTSSDIQNVNYASTQPTTTGSEIFGYPPPETDPRYLNFNPTNLHTRVAGSVTANESGVTGSVTITNGMIRTHAQSSTDCASLSSPCGRGSDSIPPGPEAHTHSVTNPEGVVTIPTNPTPNYKVAGHVHLGNTSTDYFVLVFNEQILNPDGSMTINPVHEYFGRKLDQNGNIVQDLSYVDGGSVLHGHLYLGQITAGISIRKAVVDFNGNGTTDRSVFRNGAWFAEGQTTAYLGLSGDIPAPGDYDNDGDADHAVYRGGTWFVEGQQTAYLGSSTDVPVPADYNGDGDAERAVYRPSVGGWFIEGQTTVYHGQSGDIPVPADYDGDGDADIAIWRPSVGGWYVLNQTTQWIGLSGDIPVPADYDGDGDAERGIWRPDVGAWYIQGQTTKWIGLNGDVPVPGDYDGNGLTDRAIFRRAVGGWFVDGATTVYLGASGDVPLPLSAAIYRNFF